MPVMKIRGGDLDRVEYEFTSFHPGEDIRTCGYSGNYRLLSEPGVVKVRAPARIHLSVLDMNRFAPGQPGGWGNRICRPGVLHCRGPGDLIGD